MSVDTFSSLDELAARLRTDLEEKSEVDKRKERNFVLLYAYNGTGKTRLSTVFKDAGKNDEKGDTLYFNAFTEDLFTWDNDLDNDTHRVLRMNEKSNFLDKDDNLELENRIRPFLHRYADFDFRIDYTNWEINFSRDVRVGDETKTVEDIKISRGEENIFIWCFFLAIVQLAIDEHETYNWVKFIYIDDPISSLDDNNAITVASHLAYLLTRKENKIKVVLSSHHTLFFNVMHNELSRTRKLKPYFLNKNRETNEYTLCHTGDTPFFHHVALLKVLCEAEKS